MGMGRRGRVGTDSRHAGCVELAVARVLPQDNVEWGFCIDSSLKGRILVEPFQHRSALNNDFQHHIGCGSKQRRFFAFAMRAMTLLSITLIKYQIIAHTGWRAMLLSCF